MTKRITAIVVEYNPFHNGHRYHIEKARELTRCDVLIAIMSGNWTQRGEPAVCDKWERSRFVLDYGVDLVVELPFLHATQCATEFANAAIRIASLLGATDLVFGSEINNLEELKEIADMSFDPNRFRENMEAGFSYPNSYGYLAKAYGPNDILGIAYLQAIKNTSIQPHCIRRTNVFHGSELSNNCSAKAIRLALKNGQDVSVATPMAPMLTPVDWEDYYPYLRTLLLTLPKSYLQSVLLVSEGIETHLIKQAKQSETAEEFFRNAIVRRYTKARIQRTCLHIMAHTPATLKPNASDINFVRILAHNGTGQQYLKTLRKKEGLIIASKFMQIPEQYREAEYRATVCYSQGFDNKKRFSMIQKEIYGQYQ